MEMLAVRLKQDVHCTVSDLARQFGVSERTISRDLSLMRDQGMQIDADRGRGGGVRLDRNWGIGRINLAYSEAVDLLISLAVAEQMNSPMFLANLDSVRRQLVASFSPAKRDTVERLKSRILVGVTASTYVQAGTASPADSEPVMISVSGAAGPSRAIVANQSGSSSSGTTIPPVSSSTR